MSSFFIPTRAKCVFLELFIRKLSNNKQNKQNKQNLN